ncbi:MAG: hypothetical protein ACP6IY_18565, partial [Promethearchaeia archaeon]
FLKIFCPDENICENLMLGVPPSEEERWKVINYISNREEWQKMAYNYAELMLPFISEDSMKDDAPILDSSFIKNLKEDLNFQKGILAKIIEYKSEKRKKQTKGILNQEEKFEEIYPGELEFDYGFSLFENIEFYDALYKYRLKEIDIKIPKSKVDRKFAITWLNRERINENDNLLNFDPLNVYFLPNSDELLIYKRKIPLTINLYGNEKEKGFPDLALICDDSGSMTWEPLTGEGKYDALIITIYSLLEWLKDRRYAPVIKYNFTFFSSTTRSTKWIDYFHIDEFLKPLLFSPEGEGTELNIEIFEEILNSPKDKVVVMISDGEIFNYKDLLRVLKKHNSINLNFLLIQIGKESKFARSLKNRGFNVAQIDNIKKLNKILLNFVNETYQR